MIGNGVQGAKDMCTTGNGVEKCPESASAVEATIDLEIHTAETDTINCLRNRNKEEGGESTKKVLENERNAEAEKLDAISAVETFPLMLCFKAGYFGVAVGLAAQAALWNHLSKAPGLVSYHIPQQISTAFWYCALLVLLCSLATYIGKSVLFPYAVLREALHPVRVNFFFMPSIATTFLLQSAPTEAFSPQGIQVMFYVVLVLDTLLRLFVWGEWLVSKELGLGKFYTPAMLSVVNCFVLAKLSAIPEIGEKELASALVAVGMAFYFTVFVRTFGRPLNEFIPPILLPSLFFYLAPPFSIAAVWMDLPIADRANSFCDSFAGLIFYFGLFMYILLLRFSYSFFVLPFALTWWAYTFPTAAGGMAAIEWAGSQDGRIIFAFVLSGISTLLVLIILTTMILKVLQQRSLRAIFPPDDLTKFVLDEKGMESYKSAQRGIHETCKRRRELATRNNQWRTMSFADHYTEQSPWKYLEDRSPGTFPL